MDNFVSVILNTKELDENAVVEAMLDALDAPLAERTNEYGLFESENESVVLRLQTPYELDEEESDAFAQAFADRMFEMGYNDFEIETSLGEEPGDQRINPNNSQIGANNEKDFSAQLNILTKNKGKAELQAMVKAFSDRGDHIKAYMTAVRVQKVIGYTDAQLQPLKAKAIEQRDKNPDAMTSSPKAPQGDKRSTQSADPNKQATNDPKVNTSAPKRPGAPEDTKPPKIAGVQSNGKLTNFNIDKSLPSVDVKNIRTGENFRVYGPPANVEKMLARPEIEKVYSGRGDAGARQELELRKQQMKTGPDGKYDGDDLGSAPTASREIKVTQNNYADMIKRAKELAAKAKQGPDGAYDGDDLGSAPTNTGPKANSAVNTRASAPTQMMASMYSESVLLEELTDAEKKEYEAIVKGLEDLLASPDIDPPVRSEIDKALNDIKPDRSDPRKGDASPGAGQATAQDDFEMDLPDGFSIKKDDEKVEIFKGEMAVGRYNILPDDTPETIKQSVMKIVNMNMDAADKASAKKDQGMADTPRAKDAGSIKALRDFAQSGKKGIANDPDEKEAIAQLQNALNQMGIDAGTADGIYGKNTINAVKEFQKMMGAKVDGDAGPETITAIIKARSIPNIRQFYTDLQKMAKLAGIALESMLEGVMLFNMLTEDDAEEFAKLYKKYANKGSFEADYVQAMPKTFQNLISKIQKYAAQNKTASDNQGEDLESWAKGEVDRIKNDPDSPSVDMMVTKYFDDDEIDKALALAKAGGVTPPSEKSIQQARDRIERQKSADDDTSKPGSDSSNANQSDAEKAQGKPSDKLDGKDGVEAGTANDEDDAQEGLFRIPDEERQRFGLDTAKPKYVVLTLTKNGKKIKIRHNPDGSGSGPMIDVDSDEGKDILQFLKDNDVEIIDPSKKSASSSSSTSQDTGVKQDYTDPGLSLDAKEVKDISDRIKEAFGGTFNVLGVFDDTDEVAEVMGMIKGQKDWDAVSKKFKADHDQDIVDFLKDELPRNKFESIVVNSLNQVGVDIGTNESVQESRVGYFEETYDDDDEFYEMYGEIGLPDDELWEAEYRGRKVKLNKPMRGDVKKFKVYVKNKKGNVIKVNFGDPNSKIKKSNPARRRSFRARHNCDNPGPKTKARYWSCRKW